jgi:hypothetical protein
MRVAGNGALNMSAVCVQNRLLSAIDVQNRGERSRRQSIPTRRFAWNYDLANGWLWEGRVHRFEGLKGGRARILESGSGDLREVSVTELRGVPIPADFRTRPTP